MYALRLAVRQFVGVNRHHFCSRAGRATAGAACVVAGAAVVKPKSTARDGEGPLERLDQWWAGRSKSRLSDFLIALNLLVFALDLATGRRLAAWGAKINELILIKGQWWRLLTCNFLHVNLPHIACNMFSLNGLRVLERETCLGRRRMLLIYLLSGVLGSTASLLMCKSISMGASGSILGLLGAAWVYYNDNEDLIPYAREEKQSIMQSVAFTALLGAAVAQIDNWGHAGGLLGGAALTYLIGPRFSWARGTVTTAQSKRPVKRDVLVDRPRLPLLASPPLVPP